MEISLTFKIVIKKQWSINLVDLMHVLTKIPLNFSLCVLLLLFITSRVSLISNRIIFNTLKRILFWIHIFAIILSLFPPSDNPQTNIIIMYFRFQKFDMYMSFFRISLIFPKLSSRWCWFAKMKQIWNKNVLWHQVTLM